METKNGKNKGGLWSATFGEIVATLNSLEKGGVTQEMFKDLRGSCGKNKARKIAELLSQPPLLERAFADYSCRIKAFDHDPEKKWQDVHHLNEKLFTGGCNITVLSYTVGIETKELFVRFHKPSKKLINSFLMTGDFIETFGSLSGDWSQKFLTARQIINFCESHAGSFTNNSLVFLCKYDETKPIDSEFPEKNLCVMIIKRYNPINLGFSVNYVTFHWNREMKCNENWIFVTPIICA